MIKWIIIAIAFLGPVQTSSKIFSLDPEKYPTAADCERERVDFAREAASKGLAVWLKCVEVEVPPPPPEAPPQPDPKTEVKS